jgi:hypothetical protein
VARDDGDVALVRLLRGAEATWARRRAAGCEDEGEDEGEDEDEGEAEGEEEDEEEAQEDDRMARRRTRREAEVGGEEEQSAALERRR